MSAIELVSAEIDDAAFVSLAGSFVNHYATLTSCQKVLVIHIDNWFGERWLGFAGKYKGVAEIRARTLSTLR